MYRSYRWTDIYYTAYGLTVRSEIELPELRSVDPPADEADVIVRQKRVPPVPASARGADGERFQADADTCHLTYRDIGSFLIESGERILCDPASDDMADTDRFRKIVLNQGMGLLLHQRGHLVLHVSAVAVDGRAVVFLGPRGAGKSTTAAAFSARGYPIIADDVVAITFAGGAPVVVPGISQLWLSADAVDVVDLGTAGESDATVRKRQYRTDGVSESVPLSGLYLLEEGDGVSIRDVPGRDAFFELLDNSYAAALLDDTESLSTHFRLCSRILDRTPCKRLRRPKEPSVLSAVVDAVADE